MVQEKMLKFNHSILGQISQLCETDYPHEACGLLVGDSSGVKEIVSCENTWPVESERKYRFTIDPLVMLRTERAAAERKMTILGTYHSHPDHPAEPSAFDLQSAWPVYFYLILEIQTGKCVNFKTWRLNSSGEQFEEMETIVSY